MSRHSRTRFATAKQLCIKATGVFLVLGSTALTAQETKGTAKSEASGQAPVPASFVVGISSKPAEVEAIVQYGLSLPDPPPLWLPEGFQRTADRPGWTERNRQGLAAEIAKPTPRLATGQPDLNGSWRGCEMRACPRLGATPGKSVSSDYATAPAARPATAASAQRPEPTADQKAIAIGYATFLRPRNQPVYKNSVDQGKQRELWRRNVYTDPTYKCIPAGTPRISSPAYVVQTDKDITFVYSSKSDGNAWRVIPIGGEFKANVPATPYGQSIGRWEGDTLVVEVRNLDPNSWFGEFGLFHSPNMKVTERYRRVGDILVYQAMVEDPELLAEPYFSTARYSTPAAVPTEAERCVRPATDDIRTELYPVPFLPEGS